MEWNGKLNDMNKRAIRLVVQIEIINLCEASSLCSTLTNMHTF